MNADIRPSIELARSLAVSADVERAEEQVKKLRTLDIYGHHVREIDLLAIVIDVRAGRLDSAQRGAASLSPSEQEVRDLADLLASTPEADDPDYRRWVRRLIQRSEPASAKKKVGGPVLLRHPVALAIGVGCLVGIVVALVAIFARRPVAAEHELERMITQIHAGDFNGLWEGFPELYREEADRAFSHVVGKVPLQSFEDYRVIDRGLSDLVLTRLEMLKGSHCRTIGPVFRTLSGEDDAKQLAQYLQMLSESALYDPNWIRAATVGAVIRVATAGDFQQCWKTYFRSWVLEKAIWQRMFGITGMTLGELAASKRTYAVATPDDGSGLVVIAVMMPKGGRVDIPMRFVENRWVPAALADDWRLSCLACQSSDDAALAALGQFLAIVRDRVPGLTDAKKLSIIDAKRATTQEQFDVAAVHYFLP